MKPPQQYHYWTMFGKNTSAVLLRTSLWWNRLSSIMTDLWRNYLSSTTADLYMVKPHQHYHCWPPYGGTTSAVSLLSSLWWKHLSSISTDICMVNPPTSIITDLCMVKPRQQYHYWPLCNESTPAITLLIHVWSNHISSVTAGLCMMKHINSIIADLCVVKPPQQFHC